MDRMMNIFPFFESRLTLGDVHSLYWVSGKYKLWGHGIHRTEINFTLPAIMYLRQFIMVFWFLVDIV